jgi:hypothetical protein
MRIIGLLISILLVSLLFIWWVNLSLSSTKKTNITNQQSNESGDGQTQTGSNPVDYSKQKVEEFNKASEDRAQEIDQLP